MSQIAPLLPIERTPLPTHVPPGWESHGRTVAARADRVLDWLAGTLGELERRPSIYLAGPDEWEHVAVVNLYGMPQIAGGDVVSSTIPPSWWRDYTDAIDPELSSSDRVRLREVYGDPPELGAAFADLVVVHELTHLFDHGYESGAGTSGFPRFWLAELFANLGFYGWFHSAEPETLPSLVTICELSATAGPQLWPETELDRMENAASPGNYVWYQSLLILVARSLWLAKGEGSLRIFRDALRQPHLTDTEIVDRLAALDPQAADSISRWPSVSTR